MWFFQYLIRRKIYSRIDYKFLIAGHTYGSTDQTFSAIECYTSRIDTVYVPDQWYQHVCNACLGVKSAIVVEMRQPFFRNFHQNLRKLFTERNKDEDKQTLDFKNVVWFNFGKGEKEVNGKLEVIVHIQPEGTTTACIILQEEKSDEFGCCPSPVVLPVSHPNQEGES